MIEYILWLALGLLVAASIIQKNRLKFAFAGAGWVFFAAYWLFQVPHYLQLYDYVNVVLSILAAAVSFLTGYVMLKQDRIILREIRGVSIETSLFMATTAAAIGGLSYFMFSEVPSMNRWIISTVTDQTIWLASVFGITVTKLDWNLIAVNGYKVEIILACTAIESIALFIGIIAGVRAPINRLASAFMVSVPVIYSLNLIRNVFVVTAYGMNWFGNADMSFYIAHTVLAKTGSLIALFIVAYAVLKILPEIIDMVDGILSMLGGIFKNAG